MKVIYMVNSTCNTRCFHCYRGGSFVEKDIMECKKDIEYLLQQGHEVVTAGAEVLCDIEKLSLYQLVGQDYLLSNGILLADNSKIFEKLSFYGIRKVALSWHIGFPELVSSIPEDVTLRAVRNIQREKMEMLVSCVISNRNFSQLDRISEILLENGIREVKFLQLMLSNEKMIPYLLNESQKDYFLEQIEKMRQKYSRDVFCIRLHANFNSSSTNKSQIAKQEGLFCPAGNEVVVIETDGRIFPCPFMADEKFLIGKMQGGRMTINRRIYNNGQNCLAESLFRK